MAKAKKGLSAARVAAMAAVDTAGSDQEKLVARQHLKSLKFKEIVVPRVNRAIAQLNGISKLANRSAYSWDDQQAEKITLALSTATAATVKKLTNANGTVEKFSL